MDENNVLAHYGILGMHWGVRRYQNKDGSLTPAGEKRYARDVRENLSKKKDNRIDTSSPDPNRWVKEDLNRSKKSIDNTKSLLNDVQNVGRNRSSKKTRMDLSKMSDKELQDRINRETLEMRYNDLFNAERETKGKRFARKTLNALGTTLTVGSSALALALAIKELKG